MTQGRKPSQEEIEAAARTIRDSYDPETGRYPKEVFYAISETALLPVVELVIIRPGTDEVLLTKREDDDPYYAGTWHLPGVIMTLDDVKGGPSSVAEDNAALRARDELRGTRIWSMVPLSPDWLNQEARVSKRGPENPVFYGAYLKDDEPAEGRMFSASGGLPEDIHEHHPEVIARAPEAVQLAHAHLPIITSR